MYDNYFSSFGRPPVPDDLCKDSAIRHALFWRRSFLKVFTIYGHGGPSWSMDGNHFSNLSFPNLRRLHMKFEQNWLCGFRGEMV